MIKSVIESLAAVLLIFIPSSLEGDFLVKGVLHIPGGYRYGHNVPDVEVAEEWWFGKDKMAFSSTGWGFKFGGNKDVRFIWDEAEKRLTAVDLSGHTYLEISLTADPLSAVSPDAAAWLDQFLINGRAEKTGRREAVLGRDCEEYQLAEWMVRNDDRFFDRQRTVLAAREVPFDWRLADRLYLWFASLVHVQSRYIEDLKKKEGFIMSSQEGVFEGGSRITSLFRILELREAPASQETYSVPKGFTKKEKLTVEDLTNIRNILCRYSLY